MAEEDVKRKLIPSNIIQDWLTFNDFKPGTYLLLTSDDPEKTLVLFIRP